MDVSLGFPGACSENQGARDTLPLMPHGYGSPKLSPVCAEGGDELATCCAVFLENPDGTLT